MYLTSIINIKSSYIRLKYIYITYNNLFYIFSYYN